MKVVSFDIFDTVLTRKVGSPSSLFIYVGQEAVRSGLIDSRPVDFANIRVEAEMRVRKSTLQEEISFDAIYEEVRSSLDITTEVCSQLQAIEMRIEEDFICVLPGAKELIKHYRKKMDVIVFTSEMYLPGNFIRRQLERFGLIEEADMLFVSSEYLLSKYSGNLFRSLIESTQTDCGDILHIGNNNISDHIVPKSIGIKTKLLDNGNLNRYEEILEQHALSTQGMASLFAGASRMARLSIPATSKKQEAIRDVSAGVIAPTLICYILWLFKRAEALKLTRLYFVARDGEILVQISKIIAEKLGVNCDIRYLYGSRQAWHVPTLAWRIHYNR